VKTGRPAAAGARAREGVAMTMSIIANFTIMLAVIAVTVTALLALDRRIGRGEAH
jgi:hypothetical protein